MMDNEEVIVSSKMKRIFNKIVGIFIVLSVAGISVLALVLSHNSPCPPAASPADNTDAMKAIVYRCYGSPDILELADIAKPTPADDEVLVKVKAAAVNPLDWHYMRGSPYIMRLGTGLGKPDETRLGVDFAGTIEAVGKDVKQFKPGDNVFGRKTGAFAEYVTIAEDRALALKPSNMSFEQVASVPIAAVTALQALRNKG
ncbi:MAG: NAD(P)-dependent alcohol dehydrogenase, partial [Xanthomonadales bacterium]|nr:NAD(P)-dependent alcohol dehydrogenase [Xanthomonadales bacterium]